MENVKRIPTSDSELKEDEKELSGRFSELLDILRPEDRDDVDKAHVERIKKVRFRACCFRV